MQLPWHRSPQNESQRNAIFCKICHLESSAELVNSIDGGAFRIQTIHISSHPSSQRIVYESKPFLSVLGILFCAKGSHYATQRLRRSGHIVLMQDTLSKMTLLHFLAIQVGR